jgi:hypothetical protein
MAMVNVKKKIYQWYIHSFQKNFFLLPVNRRHQGTVLKEMYIILSTK